MHKVTSQIDYSDKPVPEGFDPGARAWTVELRYRGRVMTVDYYTGSLAGYPTTAEVLESLRLDYDAGSETFDEFCSDFGYDTDSRKALRTWKSCATIATKLSRFLGKGVIELNDGDTEEWAAHLAAAES